MRLQPFHQVRVPLLDGDMQQGLSGIGGQSLNRLVADFSAFATCCIYIVFIDTFSYSGGVSAASRGEHIRAEAL